jgi:hypothetical protein
VKVKLYCTLFMIATTFLGCTVYAQKKDATWVGNITGIVKDSTTATIMADATVAVYRAKDTALLTYRLTDSEGNFSFTELPVDEQILVIVSFSGYKTEEKKIKLIDGTTKPKELTFNLIKSITTLQTVIVKAAPPVQMNGDTLEFNASAFKMNPNAQTEDLIRLLPGLTIWQDGIITYNGKEIKSVLVNGKEFFGGDAAIATQNIPKNAVDKIQVYNTAKNKDKPQDSTLEMNIKLKKDKSLGYFGKLSGGYGTSKHYDMVGSMNFFNKKTQFGLACFNNDINKIANDINTILSNSTYKALGNDFAFQSDFSYPGLNKNYGGGFLLQHDFKKDIPNRNLSAVSASLFLSDNMLLLRKDLQKVTTIDNSKNITTLSDEVNNNNNTAYNARVGYNKVSHNYDNTVDIAFTNTTGSFFNINNTSVINNNQQLLSSQRFLDSGSSSTKNVSINNRFNYTVENENLNFNLDYTGRISETANKKNIQSSYVAVQVGGNKQFDRLENTIAATTSHFIALRSSSFFNALIKEESLFGIEAGTQNQLEITTKKVNSKIANKDSVTKLYIDNRYLTVNNRENIINFQPAITLKKKLTTKFLANRYFKSSTVNLLIKEQFYNLQTSSDKSFQQFNLLYKKFLPEISFNFTRNIYGSYYNIANITLGVSTNYPTLNNLAPIIDSINQNYIIKGNAVLKPEDNRYISYFFTRNSERTKNIFSYNFSIGFNFTNNGFTNNSTIDNIGRTVNTIVNANGRRSLSLSLDFKKAYKFKKNQIQLKFSPNTNFSKQPNIVNGIFNFYNNTTLNLNPAITYTYNDKAAITFTQVQAFSWQQQKGTVTQVFTNKNSQSKLSGFVHFTKKLSVASNLTYTKNTFNKIAQQTFTIWNASASYRFFKANTAEIKFSALDILKQNTGLINEGLNNNITQGTQNVLQQYFMVTLAYFPRQFGKKNK